jgi:hypothetical protein
VGGGRSQIIRRRESLVLFKSFNTLLIESTGLGQEHKYTIIGSTSFLYFYRITSADPGLVKLLLRVRTNKMFCPVTVLKASFSHRSRSLCTVPGLVSIAGRLACFICLNVIIIVVSPRLDGYRAKLEKGGSLIYIKKHKILCG